MKDSVSNSHAGTNFSSNIKGAIILICYKIVFILYSSTLKPQRQLRENKNILLVAEPPFTPMHSSAARALTIIRHLWGARRIKSHFFYHRWPSSPEKTTRTHPPASPGTDACNMLMRARERERDNTPLVPTHPHRQRGPVTPSAHP